MVLDSFNTYKQVILKALEICDTDITDIEVRKEQMPAPVLPVAGQTELSFKLVDVLRFKTVHRNQGDVMFDMDMEESNGTRKLFQILIRLLDVVKNRKSIMMDEFDMGFTPAWPISYSTDTCIGKQPVVVYFAQYQPDRRKKVETRPDSLCQQD